MDISIYCSYNKSIKSHNTRDIVDSLEKFRLEEIYIYGNFIQTMATSYVLTQILSKWYYAFFLLQNINNTDF